MTTVIDSLVIELGLDPAKMKKTSREAIDDLRKFEDEAKKRGGAAEKSVGGIENAFSGLQKRLLGVAGLMLGGLGIEQMIQRITKLQVATSNLSATFGIQSQTLQRWGSAGERFGVPGSAVQQGLIGLQQQRFNLQNFGDPSGLMSLSWGTRGTNNPLVTQGANGQMLDPEKLALNISKWLQQAGPQGANALMKMGGLSQDFVTFLMQGPEKIKKVMEETKKLAPTDGEIAKFKELNEAYEKSAQQAGAAARKITAELVPGLVKLFDIAGKIADFIGAPFGRSEKDTVDKINRQRPGGTTYLEEQIARKEAELKANTEHLAGAKGIYRGPVLEEQRRLTEELKKLREALEKNGGATVQQQSFTTSGDNVRVWKTSLGGGGGFGGGAGGGIQSWSPPSSAGPGGAAPGYDESVGRGLSGSAYLKARRERFRKEMESNPALRDKLAGMMALEGEKDPIPVIESLMNRMDFTGQSLEKGLGEGNPKSFYGPLRRGQLPGAVSALQRNPKRMKRLQDAIDAALAGSNTIKGATDQGMRSDPNGRWPGGMVDRGGGNIFNDWGGGPGGHEGSRRYREMIQRGVETERSADVPLPRARPSGGIEEMHTMLGGRNKFAGLGGGSQSNSVTVGNVSIHTQAKDAEGIAASIKPAIQRFARIASSNNGPA